MISLPFAAALVASVLTTSFISGVFGMAGGMILMGLLLAFMPVAPAMVLHGVTQIASNGCRAWLWRAHIAWPIVLRYGCGALLAAVAAACGLAAPSKATALIFLGLATFVGLWLPERFAPNVMAPRQTFGCGLLCTALQLICGVSGPMLDLFFVRSGIGRKDMVATKAAIQTIGHTVKLAYFGQMLMAGGGHVAPAAVILAVVLALSGTQLSRHVLDAISDATFRLWSRRLIAAVAAVSLVQGLRLQLIDGD